MRLLITILIICSSFTPRCLKLDLVLLVDLSGSVEGREQFISDAVQSFIDQLDISPSAVRVSIITFNSVPTVRLSLSDDRDRLLSTAQSIRYSVCYGLTNMAMALRYASYELVNNSRPGATRMIVLITDGLPDSPQETYSAVSALSIHQIGLCGVFVYDEKEGEQIVEGIDFLRSICGDCFAHSNYITLTYQLKRLSICL